MVLLLVQQQLEIINSRSKNQLLKQTNVSACIEANNLGVDEGLMLDPKGLYRRVIQLIFL